MGLNRYFVPDLPKSGFIELPPEEAHHALRVRREIVGNSCVAFDGRGNSALCKVTQATKRDLTIEVNAYESESNDDFGSIRLAVAMPKGDRQRAVIERAVELGVHDLIPLVCQRSVSLPSESASEKWQRTIVEACKQCERNRLMTIGEPCTFELLLQSDHFKDSRDHETSLKMFAHPHDSIFDGISKPFSLYDRYISTYSSITIAIGPEGGFTNQEVQSAMEAGWRQLDLGPRILRVETAVCAASIYASLCIRSNPLDATS